MSQFSIEIENLRKSFPRPRSYTDIFLRPFSRTERRPVLHNINLQIRRGELLALLGHNGAGKTTLIKILSTLILPDQGRLFINGLDALHQAEQARMQIGYVIADERSFYWRLSGRRNLYFFAALNNMPREQAEPQIETLLEKLELSKEAERPFKDYSTGMRKKLSIIRGLLNDPPILLLDEPGNALDPAAALTLRRFMREQLTEKEGRTLILATHNLAEVELICDRAAVLHQGRLEALGEIKDFAEHGGLEGFLSRL